MKINLISAVKFLVRKNSSYIHRTSNEPLKYLTIGQLLKQSAEKYSDRDAVISCDEKLKISFGEALEKVSSLCFENNLLSQLFIGRQTRVWFA